MHSAEQFMPSSFDHVIPHVNLVGNALPMKEQLTHPDQVHSWFAGDLKNAPCYAVVRPLGTSFQIYFYYFYPYNRGKKISGRTYGNHAGDWEYVAITFNAKSSPIHLHWAHHGKRADCVWRYRKIIYDGDHPVFFIARGSHGIHYKTGTHYYISRWVRFIYDKCDAGIRIETWKKAVILTPENYTGKKDTAYDMGLKPVSLSSRETNNWTNLTYFGQTIPMDKRRIRGKSIYRLGGYNRIPMSLFK